MRSTTTFKHFVKGSVYHHMRITHSAGMLQLKGSVKEMNIEHLDIFLFSAHHSMMFYFRCSVYW